MHHDRNGCFENTQTHSYEYILRGCKQNRTILYLVGILNGYTIMMLDLCIPLIQVLYDIKSSVHVADKNLAYLPEESALHIKNQANH